VGGSRQRIGVAQWTQATEDVLPRRLGHTLLFTAQPQQMTDFYTQVLGLRVSDRIKGLVTFLNSGPGDHHIFGFIASTHRGFHHASFEVPSIDAIAIGADRMRTRGREAGWGLGRHTIGSNFFHYNPDPWGSWIEWFSDIDQIDDCWVAGLPSRPPPSWPTRNPPADFRIAGVRSVPLGCPPPHRQVPIAEFRPTAYSSNCIHFGRAWLPLASPEASLVPARQSPTRESIMSRDVAQVFADIDAFDPDKFVAHLTPDAQFRFANADPVTGRAAVREAVAGFFASIDGLTHHIRNVYEAGDTVVAQIDVEYLRKDGKTVTVPNADILVFDGDLVRDWQIYIDVAPVYA
jgi:catechol 2,3-dioxygenase-like lactoylglutathione lyase family enzyme/ketosteroid isomerase-like protein